MYPLIVGKEALEKKKKRKIITEIKRIVRAKAINVDTIKRIVPKIITIIIEAFFSYPPNWVVTIPPKRPPKLGPSKVHIL